MNTRAVVAKSGQKLVRVAGICRKLANQVIGTFSWRPPSWLPRWWRASSEWIDRHPRKTFAYILVGFALACTGGATLHWYLHRPLPHKVYATVERIPVTEVDKIRKQLVFPWLHVRFSESAARLEDLHKQRLTGVRLEPQLDGKWFWLSDCHLAFKPEQDWPADTTFRIVFDKKFFPRHVRMDRLVYQAPTPAFAINVKDLQLYHDPFNPALREVTATFELTHSVDPGELEKRIRLMMVGDSNIFAAGDPAPHFAITYGLFRRFAYLRSSGVSLPEREDFLKLTLSKGVRTSQGGAQTANGVEQKLRIPSVETMFRIEAVEGSITPNKNDEPEQLIILKTSADIATADLAKAIEIRLLPERKPAKEQSEEADAGDEGEEPDEDSDGDQRTRDVDYHEFDDEDNANGYGGRYGQSLTKEKTLWKSPTAVPDDVLAQAKPIEFKIVPSDKTRDQQHAFKIYVENAGELHVRVRKGVRAFGDYPLVKDYNAVLPVPEFPREVQIQGEGGLLALNGERKLSIRSRGLPGIEFELARVSTSQINHLVSQTAGEFQHPHFHAPYYFSQENISRVAFEHQAIHMENRWKANYSAFDFTEHLRKPADGGSERGLFFLTARGWNPEKNKPIPSTRNGRFVLVTDIGILTKKGSTGGHDVFAMSIKTGKPIAGATIEILGKNGIVLQAAQTDKNGHCAFPSLEKSVREQTPVAFVARQDDDVAFMPYSRSDRFLNFSRFDIGGDQNVLPENLSAFVFTERGVYRPGDEIHAGIVIKQRNWQSDINGLPFETEVIDARGLCVQTKKLTLPETGFTELSYQTANESASGSYSINVYLIKHNKRATLLGSTCIQVKEFLPDRMKIETVFSQPVPHGWMKPNDVGIKVTLANLYGTPATDRRITAHLDLWQTGFTFSEFEDFCFYNPDQDDERKSHSIDLGERKTDTEGQTDFDLQLGRFGDSTYALQVTTEGFEGEGGRSVTNRINALISTAPYVIGFKADGQLGYIQSNRPRSIELIAIDPQLSRIAVENLTVNIIANEYVSVLTKQENGNYAYQSELRERTVKSEKITIAAHDARYALPTTEPGNYFFELRDDQGRRLTKVCFSIVGRGSVSRSLAKNAELEMKIDRNQCNSGDDVAISLTAPFTGAGLITIERDKVYAYQWFEAKTAASVQHIRVPENFEGSGYINVAFVRSLDSKEIFVSPLSYGAVPFTANREKRRLKIDLNVSSRSRPGEPLRIGYQADRPCKLVVFAVDEGILQVTNYKRPQPLEFFFRKCALGVRTAQIVDLIIPEFSILRSMSAFGGDGSDQRLNPFKRVTEKPVVFWSGIIDADISAREVVYDVPDFFDGNLKIMAVAVSNDATNSVERSALIRGPFTITPSVPVLAAPGDEFEAGVTIANNVEGSGADAEIELRTETNAQLSAVTTSTQKLRISEGRELSATFRFHANDKLGSGEIRFIARVANSLNNAASETKRRATLSVRPPVPYMTDVRSGHFNKSSVDVPITRGIRPEFRHLAANVSAAPLGLAHGLDIYLKNFPYGCSEQITSGAFCRLMLADESDFGLSRTEINTQLEKTFSILRRRQNDQGAFGYWAPENGSDISFVSVYVMDFLCEAKSAQFAPPAEMFSAGLRNLQKMVAREPTSLSDARTLAYAIYILTREGVVTTNYVLNLRDYLDKKQTNLWQSDVTGIYLAGALHLLHKDSEAEKLIGQYRLDTASPRPCDDFYQPLSSDSQFIAVLAREFPGRLKAISADQFQRILRPIGEGEFNTLSAAYAVRALKSYTRAVSQNLPQLNIAELDTDKRKTNLASGAKLLQRTTFSGRAAGVRFETDARLSGPGIFFQVIEAGFDSQVPNEPLKNGLEVYRELLDDSGFDVSKTRLGEPVRVRLHVRSLTGKTINNVAIVDLLPGGFEIVDSSVHAGAGGARGIDYVELREDRAVFFGPIPPYALEIDYKIKSCNRGKFVVPPVFAESMYERNVKARGVGGTIEVTE